MGEVTVSRDLDELRLAGEALLGLVADGERQLVSIALGHLVDMHGDGKAHVAKIAGPQSVVRKAMREAWRHGVRAPLARSRDVRARGVLAALPDVMDLRDLQGLDRALGAAVDGLRDVPDGLVAHLAHARSYLDAAPVLAAALDGLDALPRAFVPDADAPRNDRRGEYAARRLRQAFARDVVPLVEAVTAVAHREAFGCAGRKAFSNTAGVLADVPAMGVRRRDPSGAEWMARLGTALAADVAVAVAIPALEALFARFPGVSMDRASMRCGPGFTAGLAVELSYGNARLTVTHRLDLKEGAIQTAASGRMLAGPETVVPPHRAVEFLGALTKAEVQAQAAAAASGRRTRASVPPGR